MTEWNVNMKKCDNCGSEHPENDYTFGLYLDTASMGYYGGFVDNVPPDESPAFWVYLVTAVATMVYLFSHGSVPLRLVESQSSKT